MEESGISRAVVMGRKADEYGEVTMRTSLSWPAPIHRLLFLLPGSTLTMPDRVDALARQGFRGVCLDGGWRRSFASHRKTGG